MRYRITLFREKQLLLRGSLASGNLENIKFVESINEVTSYGALKAILS